MLFAATTVTLVGVVSLAHAADAMPSDKSMIMSKLDPDGDGTASMEAAEAKFAALDVDAEGTLDATELTGIMSAKQIAMVDADKDATVAKADYLKIVVMKFKQIDKDHDGTLDRRSCRRTWVANWWLSWPARTPHALRSGRGSSRETCGRHRARMRPRRALRWNHGAASS